MNEERKKVLELLVQGKITTEEADSLLSTLEEEKDSGQEPQAHSPVKSPKFLRITVENGPQGETVNVCIPIQMLRAGIRLVALIPKGLQVPINEALKEQGIQFDLNAIRPEDIEDLVNHLGELTVDVTNRQERVKVFCE